MLGDVFFRKFEDIKKQKEVEYSIYIIIYKDFGG